jgi:hypothetical protein
MFRRNQHTFDNESLPVLAYLVGIAGFCFAFGSFLHWLLQPVVLPNPGLAAYRPPPATRIEPLVRNSDVPEFVFVADASETRAETKETTAAPAPEREPRKLARSTKVRKPERREARSRPRNATRVATGRGQSAAYAYAQDWNSWARRPAGGWSFW